MDTESLAETRQRLSKAVRDACDAVEKNRAIDRYNAFMDAVFGCPEDDDLTDDEMKAAVESRIAVAESL